MDEARNDASGYFAYSLTRLTGHRRNENRTMFVGRKEVNQHLMLAVAVGAIASIAPAGLLFVLLSVFGNTQLEFGCLLAVPVTVAVAVWYLHERDERGSGVRNGQAALHKYLARQNRNEVIVCGKALVQPRMCVVIPVVIDTPMHLIPGFESGLR